MAYQFDFQRYVDRRKSPGGGQEERGGFGDYAFSGDLRVLRKLERLKPVNVVVESTVRFWKNFRKNELLGTSVKIGSRQFPHLNDLVVECAETLDIPMPAIYVTESPHINAGTYGTNQEAFIIIYSGLVDKLNDEELKFVIGHECGHIHNNHVVYQTAASFMAQGIGMYVKWAALPATMALNAWSRRGEVTCDRAGLLCCGDLRVALNAIMKLAVGANRLFDEMDIDRFAEQLDGVQKGVGRFAEVFDSHPYLPKRIAALRKFAESSYFRSKLGEKDGRALDEIDREIEEIIQVM